MPLPHTPETIICPGSRLGLHRIYEVLSDSEMWGQSKSLVHELSEALWGLLASEIALRWAIAGVIASLGMTFGRIFIKCFFRLEAQVSSNKAVANHWKPYKILTFDIVDSILENMLSDTGFVLVLQKQLRVRSPTGITVLAPQCSSYSWMSRYSSGRNVLEPLGNIRSPSVRDGKLMVSRVILILMLIMARRSIFILEQPLQSILPLHPRFEDFLRRHVIYKVLAVANIRSFRKPLSPPF